MATVDPTPVWRVGDFEELIDAHGYISYIDRAMRCPCAMKHDSQALSTCKNCGGRGWLFVDRKETRVISQSMNNAKRFKEFGEINKGEAKITTRGEDKLGFMDRIILLELEAYYSEILRPIDFLDEIVAYPVYEPIAITNMMVFVSGSEKLAQVDSSSYSVQGNKIVFHESFRDLGTSTNDVNDTELNLSFTVRYSYHPVYHVIDANRELMRVKERTNSFNNEEMKDMPINVLCRKAHYIFDAQKFGIEIFDNTKV